MQEDAGVIHVDVNYTTCCGPSLTGTTSLLTGTTTPTLSSTLAAQSTSDAHKSAAIGPIVGEVIGGLVVLATLLIASLCLYRRWL
jgi:hypothetical protein